MEDPIDKKELSDRLNLALDQLEKFMEVVGTVSDELLIQYQIENGELDPDDLEDFLTTDKELNPPFRK